MKENNKQTMMDIRENILLDKEFFLLNFINDVPEEDIIVVRDEIGDWEGGCELEFVLETLPKKAHPSHYEKG